MIGIQYPRNFASDHFSRRVWFMRQPTRCRGGYLRGRRAFPLALPKKGPLKPVDTKFQSLKALKTPSSPLNHLPKPQWVLEWSLRLIDTREDRHWQLDHNRNVARTMKREIRHYLEVDTARRADVTVEKISTCLESHQGTPSELQGVYSVLNWWYW